MVEGAGNKCAKYLLFAFNFLFVVSNVQMAHDSSYFSFSLYLCLETNCTRLDKSYNCISCRYYSSHAYVYKYHSLARIIV